MNSDAVTLHPTQDPVFLRGTLLGLLSLALALVSLGGVWMEGWPTLLNHQLGLLIGIPVFGAVSWLLLSRAWQVGVRVRVVVDSDGITEYRLDHSTRFTAWSEIRRIYPEGARSLVIETAEARWPLTLIAHSPQKTLQLLEAQRSRCQADPKPLSH